MHRTFCLYKIQGLERMTLFFIAPHRTKVGTDALVCPPEHPYFFVKYVLLYGQTRASVPTLWRLKTLILTDFR